MISDVKCRLILTSVLFECVTLILFSTQLLSNMTRFKLNVTVNMYIPTFPVATILDSLQAHRSLHGYIHFVHESRETCHEAQTA